MSTTADRRRATTAAIVLLLVVTTAAGCAGDHAREPTLPTVNFAPKLVLEVTDGGYRFTPGPRADASVRTDPATVPGGTAIEVRNTTEVDQRVQSGTTFDTGIMRRGEHVTVVLTNDTEADKVLEVRNVLHPGPTTTITVTPAAARS